MTAMQTRTQNEAPERVEKRPPTIAPYVDVYENSTEILLLADVPGATREGIEVHIDKGQLWLHARRAAWAEGKQVAGEQRDYDYERVFTVPSGIDASKIDAELANGVLTVHLPKSESLKPRKIAIKAS
jgi:HSP20 family molecular chaperone IbpA